MKLAFAILGAWLTLASCAPLVHASTITAEDIRKTVIHLQERCKQAEAAQAEVQKELAQSQLDLADKQAKIDALALHDQEATTRAQEAALARDKAIADRKAIAARLDTLCWLLAAAVGLLAWSVASRFSANLLPPPYNIVGPIGAGIVAGMAVFTYLRYLL